MVVRRPRFWVSIRRADKCLFCRRHGYYGKVVFGWSICVRLFGFDLL